MALYLRGKIYVGTKNLSPKEATAMSRRHQVYRHGRAQGSDCDRRPEWQREAGHGNHPRNQSQQYSAVYPRSTGRAACDLGRRDLGGLALRSAAAAGAASSGLQSAPQCLIKGGEQERQGGCTQDGRVDAYRNAATGLPRRKWTADAARVGAQLSDHQQRFNEGNESAEGTVSRLGHSLCRYPGLCPALSGGMVGQDSANWSAPPRRTALSTARWIAGLAARGARGVFGGEPET